MTLATTVVTASYSGDGSSTAFAVPYPYFAATDLSVYLYDTVALALGAPVIPDTIYRATCPATVTDLDLNAIDGAHRVADFVTPPLTVAAEPESGNPWAAAADGTQVLDPPFELVPWGPAEPDMTIEQMVWVSLFSDRRAGPDDELPDTGSGPVYRGGCWFDPDFGSLLWLLVRAAINSTTLLKVRQYSIEALQWMVDDGIAAKIDVSAERQGIDQIALKVTVYKADGTTEAVNFPDLWAAYQQAA